MSIEIISATGGDNQEVLADAHYVRDRVFGDEQGIDRSLDKDELDYGVNTIHAVAYDDQDRRPVSTGRVVVSGHEARVGRVSTLQEYRKMRIGTLVMAALEEGATKLGATTIELHSQVSACEFYLRTGYQVVGNEYLEAGISHVTMIKSLV